MERDIQHVYSTALFIGIRTREERGATSNELVEIRWKQTKQTILSQSSSGYSTLATVTSPLLLLNMHTLSMAHQGKRVLFRADPLSLPPPLGVDDRYESSHTTHLIPSTFLIFLDTKLKF